MIYAQYLCTYLTRKYVLVRSEGESNKFELKTVGRESWNAVSNLAKVEMILRYAHIYQITFYKFVFGSIIITCSRFL